MPEDSKTKKAEVCFSLIERIRNGTQQIVMNYFLIGKNLCLIQEKHLWRYYGDHLRNFNDFLRDIHLGQSTAYNCMAIWKRYGREVSSNSLELPEYTRLVKILPVINEENKMEWLNKASVLEIKDLEDEVKIAKGRVSFLNCPHANTEIYIRCQGCGKFFRKTYGELRAMYERETP